MSQILTDQDFANAKRDISDIDKAVNTESIVDPRWGGDFKSLPLVSKEWDAKTQDAQSTINSWQEAINTIVVNDGVPALAVSTANGNNQQAVNDLGGVDYWAARAYQTNNEVRLTDGTIVISTIDNNSNNPNTDMTGWEKKQSANQIFDESGLSQQQWNNGVESIADLLAIQNPKNGSRVYVHGQQHGWFVFNSLRLSENDGGTIISGWERIDFDAIMFDMFACDPTGATAIDDKLLKICAASTALKKPIHQFTGTYLVNSSNEFTFTENTLLDGSKFKLGSSFSGKFICRRNDIAETILTEGAAFDEIKGLGTLQAGRLVLSSSLVFASAYVGHYAEFVTSQPLYIYRGETKGARLFTRILRNGRLENGSYFNLDLSQLTSIRLQSVAESIRIYSGFCFDESLATSIIDYFHVQSSNRIVVRNTTYIDKSDANRAVNQTRLTVSNSFNTLIDGLDATSALYNSNNTYNYTLTLSNSYDIKVKSAKALGHGWGATGSNNCSSVTFEDCTLNRIDFHEPCYDWLKVNDCIIGHWGILATMIGDLHINDSTFLNYDGAGNRGIIRSRTDTGGFCYGDLYLNNAKLGGYSENGIDAVILCQGDGVLPVGSPIEAVMFNNVYIDGLRSKYTYANVSALLTSVSATTLNKPPKVIEVKSVHGFNPLISFGGFAFRSDTVMLTMDGITNPLLTISDRAGKGTKIEAVLDNVRHADAVTVLNTANCDMRIVNSKLVRYREYNQIWSIFSPSVEISNSCMTADDYISLNTGVTRNRIALHNVRLTNPTATAYLPFMAKARHLNCRFNSSAYFTVWSGSATSGSFNTSANSGVISLYIVYGSVKRVIDIDPSTAQTINVESGVTIVIAVSGTTTTVTLNAADASLMAIMSNN